MTAAIRAHLRGVAALWLLLYLTTGVMAARTTMADDCGCTGMAAGASCPMHHTAASTARCRLVNAQAPSSGLVASIFALTDLPAERRIAAIDFVPLRVIDLPSSPLVGRQEIPDTPPPRT